MAFAEIYRRQVALLLRTIPHVAEEQCFALKGGTAINLFVRNMPRLSVDIDLTYVPIADREQSLAEVNAAMDRIAGRLRRALAGARVDEARTDGVLTRLVARAGGVQVKVEVTPVLRGCVYEPAVRPVCELVEREFGFAEIQVVSFADLYAGKLVAALDRQHPRDLFDARDLLANEGITDELREAFVVYMLSHHRPMSEVLAPALKDIGDEFLRGFQGMTAEPTTREELLAARDELLVRMVGGMSERHRSFLLSFERGEPDWSLLAVAHASDLPAVKWRQYNLGQLSPDRRRELVRRLEAVLSGRGRALNP